MPNDGPRTVVTGLGVISALGRDRHQFWDALRSGRSGVRRIESFDPSELPVQIAGEVADFHPKQYIDRKQLKASRVWSKTIALGVCAAKIAKDDSGAADLDPERFGVEFGCGLIASELNDLTPAAKASINDSGDLDLKIWGERGIEEVPPLWMLKYLPNMPACHISIMHDARGPSNSFTNGDVAGLLGLAEARHIIRRGLADFFLAGACESKLNPLSLVRHVFFQDLSKQNADPAAALKPFAAGRAGTVLGEGGVVLALEELEHAKARGATIHAEVVGTAAGFDRPRDGKVLGRVIGKAMAEAGVTAADIDHVNAAGFGTAKDDPIEAAGIRAALGDVDVFAPKAHFGNLGAAAGLIELAASVCAVSHGELPGTLNHDKADAACPVNVHTGGPRPIRKDHAVKLSVTARGQCAAVVLKRYAG